MECTRTLFNYQDTGFFSDIVTDFLNGNTALQPFYEHAVSKDGLFAAMQTRAAFPTNRKLLVTTLEEQYATLPAFNAGATGSNLVAENIQLLEKKIPSPFAPPTNPIFLPVTCISFTKYYMPLNWPPI